MVGRVGAESDHWRRRPLFVNVVSFALRGIWEASPSRMRNLRGSALALVGWYNGPACGAGSAAFDSVIAHGESALQRGSADPLVQYYVGRALNDIVALAHRDDDTYVNAAEFRPREARARRRALSLLTAAHPGLRGTRPRRDSWRTITGLVLGRSTGARYFCVYD